MNINNFLNHETIKIAFAALNDQEIYSKLQAQTEQYSDFIMKMNMVLVIRQDELTEVQKNEINDAIKQTKDFLGGFYAVPLLKLIKTALDTFSAQFIHSIDIKPLSNGWVMAFPDGSDVAIHQGTYGHENGCFESYQMPQDDGDVTGWLSEKEVVERLKINFKNLLIKEENKQ